MGLWGVLKEWGGGDWIEFGVFEELMSIYISLGGEKSGGSMTDSPPAGGDVGYLGLASISRALRVATVGRMVYSTAVFGVYV